MIRTRTILALRSTTIVGLLVAIGVALGGAASPANAASAQQIPVNTTAALESSHPGPRVEAKGYFDVGFEAEELFDVELQGRVLSDQPRPEGVAA